MRAWPFVIVLGFQAVPARADSPGLTEPAPASRCAEDDPDPTRPFEGTIRIDVIARVQQACRPTVEAFGAIGVRSALDANEATSASGGALEATGELALNLAAGIQVRGAASGRLGTGPSTSTGGTAELTLASPPGLLATEVFQRVVGQGIPGLFEGRARAPGRFDELASGIRTSIASADTHGVRGAMVPASLERIETIVDGEPVTRWRWRIGMAEGSRGDTTVSALTFRSESAGDVELQHFDLFDLRIANDRGRSRARFGGAKIVNVSSSSDGYSYFEGELSLLARKGDVWSGFGFTSDFAVTTDGVVRREHRMRGESIHGLAGGWLGFAGFVARTHAFDPTREMPETLETATRSWTFGVRSSYTRRTFGFDVAMSVEAGRSFHGRIDGAELGPAFAASAAMSITTSAGRRATPNRVPD